MDGKWPESAEPGTPNTPKGRSRASSPSTLRGRSRTSRAPSVVEFVLGDGNYGIASAAQARESEADVTEVVGDERV